MILGVTLQRTPVPPLYTYPARPLNGGPFDKAPPKRGVWAAEPKWNGWRALVHVPSGTMWNRHGKPLTIAPEFASALEILRATLDAEAFEWVDVEALERRHGIGRGTLIVLDVIPEPAHRTAYYNERRRRLAPVLPLPPTLTEIAPHSVYLTPSTLAANGTAVAFTAQSMWRAVREANDRVSAPLYEGIVMKRLDSIYPVQRRNSEETTAAWVKHRWHF